MSYRFWLGASGAGKSKQLHTWITKRAGEALKRLDFSENYIVVVPDQYTMQTQKDLVLEAGDLGGILNVDVLSFGRLSHRIFEELGADPRGVLDDMGKTLLLRRAAAKCGKELEALHSGMERPGMIAEVKSVISEFMQYGISAGDVGELAECAQKAGQGSLAARLSDLQLLYQCFLEERRERYITGEETLDLLAEAIPRSELVAGSVIVFDGFTGFTPVQNRVLLALMQTAREVVFSLDYAEDGGTPLEEVIAGAPYEEQDLFYLTRKTVAAISKMAAKAGVPHGEDRYIGRTKEERAIGRFAGNPALTHLEHALFRYPVEPYKECGENLPIHLMLASNPSEEVRQVFLQIRRLMEEKGYHYRDFAIVTGDLPTYAEEVEAFAERYEMPVYLDRNRGVLQNPLTETVRGGLEIGAGDYSYETVFRFLRSGLSGLSAEEIDRLENYCLKRGIASRKRWETAFDEEFESMREHFLEKIRPLQDLGHATAMERTAALYAFLTGLRAGEQMEEMAAHLEADSNLAAAMEYRQIYGAVMRLLDQLYELLGEEKVSAREFQELVEDGFAEIRLGTLPQQVDRILVGDIERTRLSQIRVLFFLGVNDGVIPGNSSKGGLLSDYDREFLQSAGFLQQRGEELAPTPRQQMYTQRLYLYMNLTKPTESLYISYVKTAADGGSLRPSYLIGLLSRMFPQLVREIPEERPVSQQLVNAKDAAGVLAGVLRQYADGRFLQDKRQEDEFLTLYGTCLRADEQEGAAAQWKGLRIRQLQEAAFLRYRPVPLSHETLQRLYQGLIKGSVTRLETAAGCYLRQFLQYGLRLRERDTYTFESNDSGTILHESVQRFGQLLRERNISWLEYSRETGSSLVWGALQEMAGTYRDQILFSTERGAYQLKRMQRILEQTVDVLQYQLQQGDFYPAALEQGFGRRGELQYELPDGRLILEGRIDRVDLAREDGRTYIKILDYKSGSKELDLKKVRAGLQLQLPLYMTAEQQLIEQKERGQKAVPAAMLYSRFDNPMLKPKEAETVLQELSLSGEKNAQERKLALVRRSLRPTGYVSSEKSALQHLDHSLGAGGSSQVVPVTINKDGSLSKSGTRALSEEEWQELSDGVQETVCRLSEDILSGRIDANPIRLNPQTSTCTYCPFQNSCGFDRRLPGYEYREL